MMDGATIPKSLLRREPLGEPTHFHPDDDVRNKLLLFKPLRLGIERVLGEVVCFYSRAELFLIISACASHWTQAN